MTAEEQSFATSVYEGELLVPQGSARIMRLWANGPTNRLFTRADRYWLDMCLTPRPERARGCYRDHWGPHRFEPLGEIFLMPPGQILHVRAEAGDQQASIVCEIEAAAIDRWLPEGVEWTERRLATALDMTHAHMRACLFRLAAEVQHPGPGANVLAEMIVGQLTMEVARYCEAIFEGAITGGLASWRLRLIDKRLEEAGPPPSLDELAQLCNVSVRQLTRGFRASRGSSIGDEIASTRIGHAKRLLTSPESIKAIGFALGFTSPSSFSYAFRRATGSTPRQFRQRQLRTSPTR
jgi:AraC family transcriptional regulator